MLSGIFLSNNKCLLRNMGLTFRGSDKKLEEIVWRSLTIFSFKFSFSLIMIRHDRPTIRYEMLF